MELPSDLPSPDPSSTDQSLSASDRSVSVGTPVPGQTYQLAGEIIGQGADTLGAPAQLSGPVQHLQLPLQQEVVPGDNPAIPGGATTMTDKVLSRITSRSAIAKGEAKARGRGFRQVLENPQLYDPGREVFKYTSEPVEIISAGGRRLEGRFLTSTAKIPPGGMDIWNWKSSNQTILICSGSHLSNEYYVLPMVQALTKLGHNVMIFNYSGFGESEGRPSEKHIYEDSLAAYDKMQEVAGQKGIDPEKSKKAIGYSLGGAAVAFLATVRDVDIVCDRTFDRMETPVRESLRRWPAFIREASAGVYRRVTSFDTESRIESLQGRCFWVKADEDPLTSQAFWTKVSQLALDNPEKFTRMVVSGGHFHDSAGPDINRKCDWESPASSRELWYGSSPGRDAERRLLDQWLRYQAPPPPQEEVA